MKKRKKVLHVNYEYTATSVEGKIITLNNTLLAPLHLIQTNFIYNYC